MLSAAIILIAIAVGAFGNRQRGMDTEKRLFKLPKVAWYAIFALLATAAGYNSAVEWNAISWPIAVGSLYLSKLLGFYLLLSPSWGECFKHVDKDTSTEKYAFGVRYITTKLMGYDHTNELWSQQKWQKILDWKQTSMCVRWTLFSIPLMLSAMINCWSLVPILIAPSMWVVGIIYGKFFDRQNKEGGALKYNAVEHAEPWVGAYYMLVLTTISILASL